MDISLNTLQSLPPNGVSCGATIVSCIAAFTYKSVCKTFKCVRWS